MIKDLDYKAHNEKYYKSIQYFSHSLQGDKRRSFISEVSEYNIYLAAQCIMSAEKDEDFEKHLITKSEDFAKDFSNAERSAKGFLALAEFESFEIISNLLIEVKKPSRTHLQVFIKILEGNNLQTFLSFIDVLTKVQKIPFIHYAINAYNGQVSVNSGNRDILKNLFQVLFENGNYGMVRIFLEKYNLYDDLKFIFSKEPQILISELLSNKQSKLTAPKLAYYICIQFDLFNLFPAENFIQSALEKIGKSNKFLIFGIDVAVKHKVYHNELLNKKLSTLFNSNDRKSKNKINQLAKKGLSIYLKNNLELLNAFELFKLSSVQQNSQSNQNDTVSNINSIQKFVDPYRKNSFILDTDKSINENIDIFFSQNTKPQIQILIQQLISDLGASLMQISHEFRAFEFEGIIKYILDFGCYVQPTDFKAPKLLFLHKSHISNSIEFIDINEVLKEGDKIRFRIIGINQETFRLNVSRLNEFAPKE